MVVEELGHGGEQEAAQDDAEAAEDEGPGADVEAEAARPHRHHPGGRASATRPLQWKLLNNCDLLKSKVKLAAGKVELNVVKIVMII